MRGFGTVSTNIGNRFRIGFGTAIKAGAAAAAGGIALAIAGVPKLLNAAARLESMGRKSATVFGDQLPVVQRWAREAAAGMGLTARQATGLAANFADLLVPMGFARSEAAKMATDVVGLSGALAEWSGGQRSAAEVAEILSAAMLGERDALQGLGISISQAEVDARILANAQKGLTFATEEQAAAFATQQIIFEKSKDAQTAYANSTDDLASRQAKLTAWLQGLKEAAVGVAIPALVAVGDAAVGLGQRLSASVERLNLGPIGQVMVAQIRDSFAEGDWTGVASAIGAGLRVALGRVAGLGTDLTARFEAWLAETDWTRVGAAAGTGIANGLSAIVSMADTLADAFGRWIDSVDWASVGLRLGLAAPKLVFGLVVGLLNFDVTELFGFIAEHWKEVLIAGLIVAFAPGRLLGAVAGIIGRIPFVGPVIAKGLVWFNEIGHKFLGFLADFVLGPFGRKLGGEGLAQVLSHLGQFFTGLRSRGVAGMRSFGDDIALRLSSAMEFLGAVINRMITIPARAMGRGVEYVFRPWIDAVGQMVRIGGDLIGGLLRGLEGRVGSILSAARRIADQVTSTIRRALDIRSPSGVGEDITLRFGDGLVLGLERAEAAVAAASARLAGTVVAGAQPLAGSAPAAAPGTLAASAAAGNSRVVELLARLVDLLERRGAGAAITVNDQSGSPVDTARAVALALRTL